MKWLIILVIILGVNVGVEAGDLTKFHTGYMYRDEPACKENEFSKEYI
jgi:hypothetical protein